MPDFNGNNQVIPQRQVGGASSAAGAAGAVAGAAAALAAAGGGGGPGAAIAAGVAGLVGGAAVANAYTPLSDPIAQTTDYMIHSRYEKDKHRYMLGVSSPGGFNGSSVAFVQLAADTLLWICDWTASRFNAQPIIPSITPTDPGWVLLDELYEPVNVVVAGDGTTPLYRLTGTYIFGHMNPSPNTLNNIRYGLPSYLLDNFDRTQPTTTQQAGLMDGSTGNQNRRQFGR